MTRRYSFQWNPPREQSLFQRMTRAVILARIGEDGLRLPRRRHWFRDLLSQTK